MSDDFRAGVEAGIHAATRYLRDWPTQGPMAGYFGSGQHFADAISVNRDAIVDAALRLPPRAPGGGR